MENELVGFACGLLDAPASAVGTVTSGGTESILLAVQGARDSRPDVRRLASDGTTVFPSYRRQVSAFYCIRRALTYTAPVQKVVR